MRSSRIHLTIAFSNLMCLGPTITERIHAKPQHTSVEFVPPDWFERNKEKESTRLPTFKVIAEQSVPAAYVSKKPVAKHVFPPERHQGRGSFLKSAKVHFPKGR